MKKFEVSVITAYNVEAENKEDAVKWVELGEHNHDVAWVRVDRADEVVEFMPSIEPF